MLPADRAAAAAERLWALATTVKNAGDERNLDQIRADLFLDLLQGLPLPDSPVSARDGTGRAGRGGVELTVPLTTLMELADKPGELGRWGPVIADIARQIAEQHGQAPWRFSVTDEHGHLIWHGRTSRRPTAEDAAFVQARDRRCRFPGCRRAASGADLDHTIDWQHGGPSIPPNLGVLCRRHHRLKHDTRWQLIQTTSGTFVWTSPLGQQYTVEAEVLEEPEITDDDP